MRKVTPYFVDDGKGGDQGKDNGANSELNKKFVKPS